MTEVDGVSVFGTPKSHQRRTVPLPGFLRPGGRAGVEGLTPHGLRHTAASLAIGEGANVKLVQRMLGHASAAMMLDVYADLFDSDHGDLADRLDAAVRLRRGVKTASREAEPELCAD